MKILEDRNAAAEAKEAKSQTPKKGVLTATVVKKRKPELLVAAPVGKKHRATKS